LKNVGATDEGGNDRLPDQKEHEGESRNAELGSRDLKPPVRFGSDHSISGRRFFDESLQ
jgi:hypothetical protein